MESNNLLDRLKGVERFINIYRDIDKELVEEISIDIPVDVLKNIVPHKDGDPLFYLGYILNESQLEKLNNEIGNIIKPDFSICYYVLECQGIYDWEDVK